MNYLKKITDSHTKYYKILKILIFMFLIYKIGYIIGEFIANIGL